MDDAKLNALLSANPAREIMDEDGQPSGVVVTMPVRLHYPTLVKPKDYEDDGRPKFSACLLVPPAADLTVLQAVSRRAGLVLVGKASKIRSPFREAAEKAGKSDGFEPGWTFINVSSNAIDKTGKPMRPPVCFSSDLSVADPVDFYPGCWVIAKIKPYTYSQKGNSGVAFGLRSLQMVAHDAQLRIGADMTNGLVPIAGGPVNARADMAAATTPATAPAGAPASAGNLVGW